MDHARRAWSVEGVAMNEAYCCSLAGHVTTWRGGAVSGAGRAWPESRGWRQRGESHSRTPADWCAPSAPWSAPWGPRPPHARQTSGDSLPGPREKTERKRPMLDHQIKEYYQITGCVILRSAWCNYVYSNSSERIYIYIDIYIWWNSIYPIKSLFMRSLGIKTTTKQNKTKSAQNKAKTLPGQITAENKVFDEPENTLVKVICNIYMLSLHKVLKNKQHKMCSLLYV